MLERWANEEGLAGLAPDLMAPYFERVERELQVEEADARLLGGVATVIARGCDVLGYSHRPLRRNAPGCDGRSVCDFGCPTNAKRSTNVSYVPAAVATGRCRVEPNAFATSVLFEAGRDGRARVKGVRWRGQGMGGTNEAEAPVVVLAGDAQGRQGPWDSAQEGQLRIPPE